MPTAVFRRAATLKQDISSCIETQVEDGHTFTATNLARVTPPGAMKWIHVADASLRIEAILSGQAFPASQVALPTSDLTRIVAIQPPSSANPSAPSSPTPSFIIPIPHTVVVLRHELLPQASRKASENRSRRLGRLSRQLMAKYLYHPPAISGEEDCCPVCCSGQWFFAPAPRPAAQSPRFMC
jgi:hypothetical protein